MEFNYDLYPGRKLEPINFIDDKKEPIISIITPFYNSKGYIKETANSVLNQTFPYWEWLIIDDGSEDKQSLLELNEVEKLDYRIKIFHKENEGPAKARDFGVSKTNDNSQYLVFLDDDDIFNKTYLECAYWTLVTNKEASWAYSDTINFGEQNFEWKKWFDIKQEKKENLLVVTAMIKKEDFLEVNGFELQEKAIYEDWNLWLKLLAKGKYPVRMSFLGFWYRKKGDMNSELVRTSKNRERAIEIVRQTSKNIKDTIQAIQYPKQDYYWDEIIDTVPDIIVPQREEDKKIKILMFVPWMVTGGADKFNLDLIGKLDKNKFEVILISTQPNVNLWRQKFEELCIVYDLTTFLDKKYWVSFINYLVQVNQINLIFNTNSQFGYSILPYLKAKYPELPILDYIHMEEWYNRNGGYSRDSSAIASVIDKTLVCNRNSENILIKHFNRKPEEIQTVYIGVDEKKYNPELYNKEKLLDKYKISIKGKYIISFIARVTEQKRPHLLVKIIEQLKKKREDFIFLIVGDGNMLHEIKKKIKSLDLLSNVIFLGNIAKTEEIYAISDLTINCSIKEGLALTSYESLSMGVPVISADVGGQKELINEEVGVIVPCLQDEAEIFNFKYSDQEINQYVIGIEKILSNLAFYKGNCRKRILNGFTIDKMVENMSKIFEDTVINPNQMKVENGKQLSYVIDITKELIVKNFTCFIGEYEYLCGLFTSQYLGLNTQNISLKQRLWEHVWWRAFVKFLKKTGLMKLIKKAKLDKVAKKVAKQVIKI